MVIICPSLLIMNSTNRLTISYNQKQNTKMRLNRTKAKTSKKKSSNQKPPREHDQLAIQIKKCQTPREHQNTNSLKQTNMTIFRKHKYDNKQITEIYDMKTGTSTVRSKSKLKYTLAQFNQIEKIGPYLVNVTPLSNINQYVKTQWKQLYGHQRSCNCSKSSCLQNYCYCFQTGVGCKYDCLCINCKNIKKLHSKSEELIKKNLENKQDQTIKIDNYEERHIFPNTIEKLNYVCHCRKTGNCLKSYCGCHRLGINCSESCMCIDCKN